MLHTVEFSSFCGGTLAPLSNMFAWLDARGLRPVISRQVDGDGTAVRLGFSSEAEALAFVCAFGGRLIRQEPKVSVA